MTITTHSESETERAGRELAPALRAGSVVLLYGDLGAGKTAFVRGMAEGLGVPRDTVSSPTFALIQEYRGGRLPLLHVDLYRLNDAREIDDLGLDELGETGVMAIEWADKLPRVISPGAGAVAVHLTYGEDDVRRLELTGDLQS